jgi:hypothetical protein
MKKNLVIILMLGLLPSPSLLPQEKTPIKPPSAGVLIQEALRHLLALQDPSGGWSYEGVYRVQKDLPVGYRIGGTAAVASTLLIAAPKDEKALTAVERALAYVLKELDDPLMVPSTDPKYDVRVWGHACALGFFCQVRTAKVAGKHQKEIDAWMPKLIAALVTEEIPGGGWNYANRKAHASFVTAPVTQALLLAHGQGEKVPEEILQRARKVLEVSRTQEGGFLYSGTLVNNDKAAKSPINLLPGSIARSAVCETTLKLLGGGSDEGIRGSVAAFYQHWDELEKRRQKPGTHIGDYKIAPYFFYYGHRYCAQAIEMLPAKDRPGERGKLLDLIVKTRDADGTWNDRVFPRSRGYCSAMVVLALLGEQTPLPPVYKAR